MVRKSKRKQTIVAFEKNILPITVNVKSYESLLSSPAEKDNSLISPIFELLKKLSSCESQSQQIKYLQESKSSIKEILSQSQSEVHKLEIITLAIKLLSQLLCDPSHIWFRKYLEWLFEALIKTTIITTAEIRLCIREVCIRLLDICRDEDLLTCSIDRCFEWISTFQWMYQFDKEISWLDDAEWISEQGCWNSSVWPAGQDLGDGTLLKLINAMEPLLQRCAQVLTEEKNQQQQQQPNEINEDKSRGATELMRFAECAGECMRVLSAILKPRRGGIISPLSCGEQDQWSILTDRILSHGCKLLSSDLVSKDVLTSTALTVINIQWLLRVRLWEQAELIHRHRTRTASEIKVIDQMDNQVTTTIHSAPNTGLQLIGLLSLLRLDPKSEKDSTSEIVGAEMANSPTSPSPPSTTTTTITTDKLVYPYSLLVGISPIIVNSLSSFVGDVGNDTIAIPYLSRCALLRACISVYDLSALMFQPHIIQDRNLSTDLKDALAYVVTSGKVTGNQIRYSSTYMITPSEVEKVASFILYDMIPSHIRNTKDLFDFYTSSGLFFGLIYEITSSLCLESATPTLRLYGLQTMETWLGRIENENLCARAGTDDIVTGRDGQPVSIGSKILRNMLISRLTSISLLLTKAWSHPAKLVNHMVPVVYQRVVDLNHILDATMQSRSLVGGPDHPDIWEPFINNALNQPVEHRGRYQALSALLPNVGGQKILQLHPQIFRSLILSMRVRDVGSSVGSFFGNLLRSLFADALLTPHSIRKMYLTELAEALSSSEYKLRINTADYMIPEILSIDPLAGPLLIEKIRKLAKGKSSITFVQSLWGIVSVALHARLLGKSGGDIVPSDIYLLTDTEESLSQHRHHWRPLTIKEMESICLCDDVDLRLAGLAVLTASQRTINPLPDVELVILRKTLPYSLKSPLSDIRQRVLRVLRILITRLKESYRSCIRDLKKLVTHQYQNQNQSIVDNCIKDNGILLSRFILKQNNISEIEKFHSQTALTIIDTLEWLSEIILTNIYPGAPNDREMMALEMLRCILNGVTGNISSGFNEKTRNSHITSHDDAILESALLSFFYSKQMTQSLLNLLISSWDKTRVLAAEILLLMPRPLPGYDTPHVVASLWNWGSKLAGSAKQRESDSGALLLRVVHVIYSMDLKWNINVISGLENNLEVQGSQSSSKSFETNSFISHLCFLLDSRLSELSAVFDAICKPPSREEDNMDTLPTLPPLPTMLSHGLVLTLKYCLEDIHSSGLLATHNVTEKTTQRQKKKSEKNSSSVSEERVDWSATIRRVMNLALNGLQTALQIVAETPVDNYFAPVPKQDAGKDHLLQQETAGGGGGGNKISNTHGYASDSFMLNSGIFMDLEEPSDENEGKEDSNGRRMQYAVVGAWLLVKESCSLLAKLVEISPPPMSDSFEEDEEEEQEKEQRKGKGRGKTSNSTILLTTDEISNIGMVILDSLSRLKHNGAIAEAQVSLQSVCESVLKYSGRSNISLSHLPLTWLHNLINKLNGEQQVFILRRSAGFAFSFLSLLRAEPKNCKPILLPLAMNILFEYAAKGCVGGINDQLSTDPPSVNVLEGVAWRTIVHSLNILRLIILDATLGPDLHPFISQATKIAVRGFQSPLWAIRNSSMMVFSAIVQRTIDNDKKESGGRRAATPREFFLRYPSLFPFILGELARILNAIIECDERGLPINVIITVTSLPPAEETHPSLYPILLMLSKMRTDTLESVPSKSKVPLQRQNYSDQDGDDKDLIPISEENCNIDLFIPLVQLCANQRLFQVRVMAAKALSSLVPLQKVPEEIGNLLQPLIGSFKDSSKLPSKQLSSNLLHGSLLQILDLSSNLQWYMSGDSASMGTNEILYSSIILNLNKLVIPKLVRLQQSMIAFAVAQEKSTPNHFSSYFPYAPIILLTFKRIVSIVSQMYSNDVISELLIKTCEMNISALFDSFSSSHDDMENIGNHPALVASKIPFAPLLWKESLVDLTKQLFRSGISKIYPKLGEVYPDKFTSHSSSLLSPSLNVHSISDLMTLLQHPISEVREGILQGCLNSFLELTEMDLAMTTDLPTRNSLILTFLNLTSDHQNQSFLTILFKRIIIEFEPPILQITLQLLLNITLWVPFSSLDDDTKEDCLSSFRTLLQVACGIYDPDTMLDFLDQTLDKSTRSKFADFDIEKEENKMVAIAPTMAASYSLQILGWMVRSFFESSIMNWNDLEKEDPHRPFGQLLPESECGPRGSRDSDDDTSIIMCYSWHAWSWLRLVELAGLGEGCGVDSRYAAAKSLLSSKALFWCTRSSVDGIRQPFDDKYGRYSGGGAYSCRVWSMALKMLQDDDSDVRNVVNTAVGTPAKLATVLFPELESWFTHQLTHLPKIDTPIYDELQVEPIEQVMKAFFGDSQREQSHETEGSTPVVQSFSKVQWTQGIILEQISLPFSLAILWSLLQNKQQGAISDWISESDMEVTGNIQQYMQSRTDLYSPSSLILLDHLINLIYDSDQGVVFPPPPRLQLDHLKTETPNESEIITKMEVPEKIFEADQTNLFEELTIFSSSLTYSLACVTTLLPCSQTLSISIVLCQIGIQALDVLIDYLQQQQQQQQQLHQQLEQQSHNTPDGNLTNSSLWLGGLTYHPIYYLKIYNSLIGVTHLCQLYREDQKYSLLGKDQEGRDTDEERDACHYLFSLLLTIITKAKRLMIQIRSQHGFSNTSDEYQRVNCLIHPSIVSLLVAISGSHSIQLSETDQPLCTLL